MKMKAQTQLFSFMLSTPGRLRMMMIFWSSAPFPMRKWRCIETLHSPGIPELARDQHRSRQYHKHPAFVPTEDRNNCPKYPFPFEDFVLDIVRRNWKRSVGLVGWHERNDWYRDLVSAIILEDEIIESLSVKDKSSSLVCRFMSPGWLTDAVELNH